MMLLLEAKEIPAPVRDALAEVDPPPARRSPTRSARSSSSRRRSRASPKSRRGSAQNLETVSEKTEYYQRLLKKLDEQETALEGLQKDVAERQGSWRSSGRRWRNTWRS